MGRPHQLIQGWNQGVGFSVDYFESSYEQQKSGNLSLLVHGQFLRSEFDCTWTGSRAMTEDGCSWTIELGLSEEYIVGQEKSEVTNWPGFNCFNIGPRIGLRICLESSSFVISSLNQWMTSTSSEVWSRFEPGRSRRKTWLWLRRCHKLLHLY